MFGSSLAREPRSIISGGSPCQGNVRVVDARANLTIESVDGLYKRLELVFAYLAEQRDVVRHNG